MNGLGPSRLHLIYNSNREMCNYLSTLVHTCASNSGDLWGSIWCFQHQTDTFYLSKGINYVEDVSYPQLIHFKSVYKWFM